MSQSQDPARDELVATGKPLEIVDVRTGMFGVSGSGDTSGFGGLVRTVAMPGASDFQSAPPTTNITPSAASPAVFSAFSSIAHTLPRNCVLTPTVSQDFSSEIVEPPVLARNAYWAPESFRLRHCALKSPGFSEY